MEKSSTDLQQVEPIQMSEGLVTEQESRELSSGSVGAIIHFTSDTGKQRTGVTIGDGVSEDGDLERRTENEVSAEVTQETPINDRTTGPIETSQNSLGDAVISEMVIVPAVREEAANVPESGEESSGMTRDDLGNTAISEIVDVPDGREKILPEVPGSGAEASGRTRKDLGDTAISEMVDEVPAVREEIPKVTGSEAEASGTTQKDLGKAAISEMVDVPAVQEETQKVSGNEASKERIVDPVVERLKRESGSPKSRSKRKLKKQLSVRFMDEEESYDGPDSPERPPPIERKGTFGANGRSVRVHIHEGLLRWLHPPDSYDEMDVIPLDQGVQSYPTFDWDSATRHRPRSASVGGSSLGGVSDSVSSPPPLMRLGSIISTLSQDEVDLYRSRGKPSLSRMESFWSTISEDIDYLPENRFSTYAEEHITDTSGHPYRLVYDKRRPFNDKEREPFLEEDQISVHITDIGRVSESRVRSLNPNLYFIEIHHGQCIWSVRRRYHHFLRLHKQMLIYKATLNIPFGDSNHRGRSYAYREKSRRSLPHFPRTPDALVRAKHMANRMSHLQKYLQAVLDNDVLRNHPIVLEFFEVSELSFIDELGLKAKEGWVLKKSGGRHVPSGICSCCPSCKVKAGYSKRWLVTKDSFVAYMRPTDGSVRTVMLFDRSFKAVCGKDETGRSKCLILSNQHRTLKVKCTSKLAAREWMVEVLKASKRSVYNKLHPYGSFAPPRTDNFAHWFVDGELYFQSVADAIEAAQDEIFITDWWFNPDIFLKRPAVEGNRWKVDELLRTKAKQGVKIFILLYKEVELALGLQSRRTKLKLQQLHPNIKVMRHPDHPPGGIILWAHHEKMVVIDQAIAFLGGLDICYGRWDDFKHRLTDLGSVARVDQTPEKKKRSMITTTSLEMYKNSYSLEEGVVQQMPKQRSVPDLAPTLRHFRAFNFSDVDVPQPIPESDREADEVNSGEGTESEDVVDRSDYRSASLGDIKPTLRDFTPSGGPQGDDWVVPVTLAEERMAYLGVRGNARLWPGKDYCNFVAMDVIQPHIAFQDSVDRSTTPRMPWHDISGVVYGNAARDVARHFIERWNCTKEEKTKQEEGYPYLMPRSSIIHSPLNIDRVKGSTKCKCQILRSADHWSAGVKDFEDSIHQAYLRVIREAKHYIYIENQFFISIAHSREVINGIADALYERIMKAHREKATFRVYVVQPLLPSFMGEVGSDSGKAIHAILHWEYRSMCRGKDSLLERLKANGVANPRHYIVFNGLRNWGELAGGLVTELVYVHSKLLIADDDTVIIGSANINDRSLLGSRDSELAVLVRDTVTVDSIMDGKPYQAGVFASGLRKRLFEEHLGILQGHWKQDVTDPVSEYFFKGVWTLTASNNTINFEKVFCCVPTNSTRTFQQLRGFRECPTLAQTNEKEARKVLKNIRGFLVLTPLNFLSEEDLSPSITTQEGIAPTKLWT